MNIIILVTFIVAFLMSFFSYRQGIKDGQSLHKDEQLKPLQQPKIKLTDAEKEMRKKQQEELFKKQEGLMNMMNYANRRNT